MRRFRFGRIDGTLIARLWLEPDGTIGGYGNDNEASWAVRDGTLVFLDRRGTVTTSFDTVVQREPRLLLTGAFVPYGRHPWHTLQELDRSDAARIIEELLNGLYGGEHPACHAEARFRDDGYPHTNLVAEVAASVLDVVQPGWWLEIGAMLGGSAIRVAERIKSRALPTQIVCVDPFTGDVNMWADENDRRRTGEWQFLRLERGRPTIYDRFLANVVAAGHADVILPIMATSIVGLKLLRRLWQEGRISSLPGVIYLDSAHEPDETFLELRNCWDLLPKDSVLMGDDWGWDAVRNDVMRFASTAAINRDLLQRLTRRHPGFIEQDGILLDRGQWLLAR